LQEVRLLLARNLVSITDLTPQDLEDIIRLAQSLKGSGLGRQPLLAGKTLALLFEKPSLRTRVSFHVAMRQLGGDCIYLSPAEVGLGQRESVADVARTLSRYVDCIAARTFSMDTVEGLARHAGVPVINALSDREHPCQTLADLLTIHEKKGGLRGIRIAFIGDGNNVAASLALGAAMAGAHFFIASPPGYELPSDILGRASAFAGESGGSVQQLREPAEAARDADVVYTDVWASMGQEHEAEVRRRAFAGYQVDTGLMALAKPGAIFMHDLPAHRGEEVTDDVIDGPQSVVFDQAENRMHAQKALLALLLGAEV
jgi:ornithine carbamoyltransferase